MADDRVRAGYDAVAATYEEQFADELDRKPLERGVLDAFCEMAPPGAIADIGCGPGHITRYLAERRDDVLGVDLSPEMIAVARRRHPRSPRRDGRLLPRPGSRDSRLGRQRISRFGAARPGTDCGHRVRQPTVLHAGAPNGTVVA
jgi:SAM-dependent methyltransferase